MTKANTCSGSEALSRGEFMTSIISQETAQYQHTAKDTIKVLQNSNYGYNPHPYKSKGQMRQSCQASPFKLNDNFQKGVLAQ